MQKIGQSTSSANVDGEFTVGNPGAGVDATQIMVPWLNSIQRELVAVVQGAGLALDQNKDDQVLEAMRTIIRQGASSFALDIGVSNTYVTTYFPAVTTLADGMILRFRAKSSNSGDSTFTPGSIASKPLIGLGLLALQGGEIVASGVCTVVYSATLDKWVLIHCTGGALQVMPGTKSNHAMQLGQSGLRGGQAFQTPGTFNWICPAGVFRVFARVWGGGASGAGGVAGTGAGGGGSGGYTQGVFIVVPGVVYIITVGAGGTTSAPGANGVAGGSSSFAGFCSATGGVGGFTGTGGGGAGGSGSNGGLNLIGGTGGPGNGSYGGAGGGAPMGGSGGNSTSSAGLIGVGPGGGGSGGGGSGSGFSGASGAGGTVDLIY